MLYDLDRVAAIPYTEAIKISIWNNGLQMMFTSVWGAMTPLENDLTRKDPTITNAEIAERALQFNPIGSWRLSPSTYTDYLNMEKLGLTVRLATPQLEREYLHRQDRLARILGAKSRLEIPKQESTCIIG